MLVGHWVQQRSGAARQARLRDILYHMPVMFVAMNEDRKILFWNREAERVTGYTAEEAMSVSNILDLFGPDKEANRKRVEEWNANPHAFRDLPWRVRHKDGHQLEIIWSSVSSEVPIPGWPNWGTGTDITARVAAEKALEKSKKRYQTLFNRVPVGLIRGTPEGRLIDANPAAVKLMGYPDRETTLATDTNTMYANPAERAELVSQLLEKGMVSDFKAEICRYDETRFWAELSVQLTRDEAAGQLYIDGAILDITARQDAEQQRVDLVIERERANVLEHFAQNASDGILNPLAVLKVALAGLRDYNQEPPFPESRLKIMDRQIDRLDRTFTNMFLLVRLASRDALTMGRVALSSIKQQVMDSYEALTAQKSHRFEWISAPAALYVRADRGRVVQAIQELVFNALIYTPDGGQITITERAEDGCAVIAVADTGIGISEEHQAYVFERFYRGTTAQSMWSHGAGLGLPLARRIIELHDGQIDLDCPETGACTFTVRLPLDG
ncbi:MAG: PAS domain S-box protein [Anaerolineae bacterium]|nr:PAS domain S-box protein [Anaerolineae bacterium]